MATEQANFHSVKSTFTALMALAPQFLGTNPIDEVHHVLYSLAAHFFGRLPGIILAVVQTSETYTLSHAVLVFVLQALAQSWPLPRFIFMAA